MAGLCVFASPSSATVVKAGSVDEEQTEPPALIVLDLDGVVNHVSIGPGPGRSVIVEDRGAPVRAADSSCVSLDIHRARCALPSNFVMDVGSGDDTIIMDSAITLSASIFGGDGADRITAAAGNDFVHGGLGNDDLHAGAGDDELIGDNDHFAPALVQPPGFPDVLDGGPGTDRIRYANNLYGVTANTSPSSGSAVISGVVDQLRAIEQMVTGSGPDTLVGDDDNDALDGGSGANVIIGGGGRDILAGNGRLDGGPGSDALQPAGHAQVTCGAGDDGVELRGRTPNPTLGQDCERLFVKAPSGLKVAFTPTVTPAPSVRGRRLRFRLRCTLGAKSRQVCRVLMTIRDNNARELGHAREIVAPNSTGVITVPVSRAVAPAKLFRVSLRIGAIKGRTRLTRWSVPG